MQLQAIKIKR